MSKVKTYASVRGALTDTPEQAANLRARAELMQQIAASAKTNGWTQTEAAQRCGITQPRMSDLLGGRAGACLPPPACPRAATLASAPARKSDDKHA